MTLGLSFQVEKDFSKWKLGNPGGGNTAGQVEVRERVWRGWKEGCLWRGRGDGAGGPG